MPITTSPLTPGPLSLIEAVEAFKRDALSSAALMRAVAEHSTWRVAGQRPDPSQPDALALGVLRPKHGGRILELFSDAAAVAACREGSPDGVTDALVTLPGHRLLPLIADLDLDRLNIDPLSPHGFHYKHPQIPALVRWGHTVAVERTLDDPGAVPDPWTVLRHHDAYHAVVRLSPSATNAEDADADIDLRAHDLVLAPDPRGRTLAALFTAPDTAAAFVDALASDDPDGAAALRAVPQHGHALFAYLKTLKLDGIVFNPLSSRPPRALSARVLDQLITH